MTRTLRPDCCRNCGVQMIDFDEHARTEDMHEARGLCRRCHRAISHRGGLDKFPLLRPTPPPPAVTVAPGYIETPLSSVIDLEEYDNLREQGLAFDTIARMLGKRPEALRRQIQRRDAKAALTADQPCPHCGARGAQLCQSPTGRAHNGRYARLGYTHGRKRRAA